MRKGLLFLFFIKINLLFAQSDTVVLYIQKGFDEIHKNFENSPYRLFLGAGGICGNPVVAYIDTSFVKTKKDSLKAEKRVNQYFALAQKNYFNMIYKPLPDFSGTDFLDKPLITSDFYGKKTIVYFFSASTQLSFERLETMIRLQKKYAEKGYQFLMLSPDLKEELIRYDALKDLPFSVLANQRELFNRYCYNISKPFFIISDEKGIVKKVFLYSNFVEHDFIENDEEEEKAEIKPGMKPDDMEKAFEDISKKYLFIHVKDREKKMKEKDYFWNQINEYLSLEN